MFPNLFVVGPVTLHTYGLLVALGLILAAFVAQREARVLSISQDMFWDLSLGIILGGMVGARILYVIVSWSEFSHDWLGIFRIWDGGLVFYGGVVGGFLSGFWFIRRHQLPFWPLADLIAPALPLGHVLGRLGCFFAGCCYGRASQQFGLIFPALGDHTPHLPTQLYEAGFNLLLFSFLWWRRKVLRPAGRWFWMYVMLYAVWRFGIEFLRGDAIRGTVFWPWLHTSQLVALLAILTSAFFWFYLGRRTPRASF